MTSQGENPPQTITGLVRAFRQWARTLPDAPQPLVTGATAAERQMLGALGGIAEAICRPGQMSGPAAVRTWAASAPVPPPPLVEAVRDQLGREQEPLSQLYNACVSAAHRRHLGTVFTPDTVVEHMLSLAERQLDGPPAVVVDPGAGVGAFTIAAALRWPKATIIAVDINVVTLGLLAARICFEIDAARNSAHILRRIDLRLSDYLDELGELFAENAPGPVLACGNPPYTRIQSLLPDEKRNALRAASSIIDSGHANLAMIFQAATLRRMRETDASCMVLPGSFVYTRASRGLRRSLWSSRRPVVVHRWRATDRESWAVEFRSQLPEAIRRMMEELLNRGSDGNHAEAIQERLKRIEQLMRFTKYRRTPAGMVNVSGEALGGSAGEGDEITDPKPSRSGSEGGRQADLYGAYVDEDEGDPAEPIVPKVAFPEIQWVSIAAGTRQSDDNLEDRAAAYVNSTQNILLVSEDFRVFTDLVQHFMRLYEGYAGAEQTIPEVVKEWYSQQLVEAVLGVQAVRGSAKWPPNEVDSALSEAALTAVVMPRYNLYQQVSRVLGSKLGSVKSKLEAAA